MIKNTMLRHRLTKLFCVTLSGAMMLGAFTSCGSGRDSSKDSKDESKNEATDSDAFDPES